jgi:hypothetical protein
MEKFFEGVGRFEFYSTLPLIDSNMYSLTQSTTPRGLKINTEIDISTEICVPFSFYLRFTKIGTITPLEDWYNDQCRVPPVI